MIVMNKRYLYFIGFLICTALLAIVYYLQYVKNIHPCLLCIVQRAAYFMLAIICLIATLHNPRKTGQRIYAILLILASLFGGNFALRQLILQHLPPGSVPSCAPSINFMLHNFPLNKTLQTLFYGSGDCALIHWKFFGLSLAWWSLFFFIFFFIASLILLFKKIK